MPDACKSPWQFYCWIRVVDVTAVVRHAPPPPPVSPGPLPSQAPFPSQNFERTVRGPVTWGGPGHPPNQVVPPNGQSVSAEPTGVWAAVNGFHGRDGELTAFDYGPAFLDEEKAIDWIANKEEGRIWDRESLNRFLMSFTFSPSGVAK
jgi:hypothetical protein